MSILGIIGGVVSIGLGLSQFNAQRRERARAKQNAFLSKEEQRIQSFAQLEIEQDRLERARGPEGPLARIEVERNFRNQARAFEDIKLLLGQQQRSANLMQQGIGSDSSFVRSAMQSSEEQFDMIRRQLRQRRSAEDVQLLQQEQDIKAQLGFTPEEGFAGPGTQKGFVGRELEIQETALEGGFLEQARKLEGNPGGPESISSILEGVGENIGDAVGDVAEDVGDAIGGVAEDVGDFFGGIF